MKRRNFLKMGAASFTGGLLASCGQTGGLSTAPDNPEIPVIANDNSVIPATNNRTYFITEGFVVA